MRRFIRCIPLLAVVPSLACTVLMRDPDYYHYDVMKALEPREEALKVCYDKALETDDRAAGTVVAAFTVEKKTGVIKDVAVVGDKTTAPTMLAECATAQLEGLTIEAPDAQDGAAEYQWDFVLNIDEEELAADDAAASQPQPEDKPAVEDDAGAGASAPAETPAGEPATPSEPATPGSKSDTAGDEEPEPEAEVTFEIGE